METCSNCKHWRQTTHYIERIKKEVGRCEAFLNLQYAEMYAENEDTEEERELMLSRYYDGSGRAYTEDGAYFNSFVVSMEDFYCNMWRRG